MTKKEGGGGEYQLSTAFLHLSQQLYKNYSKHTEAPKPDGDRRISIQHTIPKQQETNNS